MVFLVPTCPNPLATNPAETSSKAHQLSEACGTCSAKAATRNLGKRQPGLYRDSSCYRCDFSEGHCDIQVAWISPLAMISHTFPSNLQPFSKTHISTMLQTHRLGLVGRLLQGPSSRLCGDPPDPSSPPGVSTQDDLRSRDEKNQEALASSNQQGLLMTKLRSCRL